MTTRRHGFAWLKSSTTITQHEISFKWLPWVDGKINYCSAQGSDVLSGWYSGCWMASYTEADELAAKELIPCLNVHPAGALINAQRSRVQNTFTCPRTV